MKKITFLAICLCLGVLNSAWAQREETLFGSSGLRFSGIWGGSTLMLSKFNNDYAFTQGGHFALEFGKALSVGWAAYQTEKNIPLALELPGTNNRFSMEYSGLLLSYAYKANKTLHPTVSLVTGGGKVNVQNEGVDRVFVVQPAIGLELNLFRWCHIGLEGGYNFVTNSNFADISDGDLSAPYGAITFKFGWSWGKPFGKRSTNSSSGSTLN